MLEIYKHKVYSMPDYKFFKPKREKFFPAVMAAGAVLFIIMSATLGWEVALISWWAFVMLSALLPLFWIGVGNKLWYFKIIAGLFPRTRVVQLMDFQGTVTHNLALIQDDGRTMTTFVFHQNRIGPLVLHENGLVTGPCHGETYVMFWQPTRKQDLMMWLLQDPVVIFQDVAQGEHKTYKSLKQKYHDARKPWQPPE
jgi:hypothetical protein